MRGAAELIQNLQELASKGVLIAEKVRIHENFLVTFHNCIKLCKM
jgi:hypothetical protein